MITLLNKLQIGINFYFWLVLAHFFLFWVRSKMFQKKKSKNQLKIILRKLIGCFNVFFFIFFFILSTINTYSPSLNLRFGRGEKLREKQIFISDFKLRKNTFLVYNNYKITSDMKTVFNTRWHNKKIQINCAEDMCYYCCSIADQFRSVFIINYGAVQ